MGSSGNRPFRSDVFLWVRTASALVSHLVCAVAGAADGSAAFGAAFPASRVCGVCDWRHEYVALLQGANAGGGFAVDCAGTVVGVWPDRACISWLCRARAVVQGDVFSSFAVGRVPISAGVPIGAQHVWKPGLHADGLSAGLADCVDHGHMGY